MPWSPGLPNPWRRATGRSSRQGRCGAAHAAPWGVHRTGCRAPSTDTDKDYQRHRLVTFLAWLDVGLALESAALLEAVVRASSAVEGINSLLAHFLAAERNFP